MLRGIALIAFLLVAVGAVRVQVFLNDGDRPTPVVGDVVSHDDTSLTLQTNRGEKTIAWTELTPSSAFTARMRIEPPETADQWLALGEFGWSVGAEKQAESAFARAMKINDAMASSVDAIKARPSGTMAKVGSNDEGAAGTPDDFGQPEPTAPVQPPTATTVPPELVERWAAAVKQDVERLRTEIGWQAGTFETDHCLVFTDWPADEHAFMAHNLEAAYAAVCQLFEVPLDEDVLAGKLPIFMFNTQEMYQAWARTAGLSARSQSAAGLFISYSDGRGMLVMWKPDYPRDSRGNATREVIKRAEDRWAATLSHEFTHGFMHRYRGNRYIPSWLNEGTAETVEHALFPRQRSYERAREYAQSGRPIAKMFDESAKIEFEQYPVAHTLVEMLIRQDPKAFQRLIHRFKAGEDLETVLQAEFGVDYVGLEAEWRRQMLR
ncbi:MAG: hypothetical protein AAGD32_16965 [Planctomycetota bacterium]